MFALTSMRNVSYVIHEVMSVFMNLLILCIFGS